MSKEITILSVWLLATVALITPSAHAAEFRPEKQSRHGVWEATLYRNLGNNELFCAAEAHDGETDFRINRYKASGETFLEIYNPKWTMMSGETRFQMVLDVKGENYNAELRGRSWGDSYTHDFTDTKNYETLLGLIAASRSFDIKNANSAPVARFDATGARDALLAYLACLED